MKKLAWGGVVQNREERHLLKRQVVLQVAAKTIRQKGYNQTTLTDISGALHISKPALYYYFESKDQIMFEIQHLAIDMLLDDSPADRQNPFLPGLSVTDRLAQFVRRVPDSHLAPGPGAGIAPPAGRRAKTHRPVHEGHSRRWHRRGVFRGFQSPADDQLYIRRAQLDSDLVSQRRHHQPRGPLRGHGRPYRRRT